MRTNLIPIVGLARNILKSNLRRLDFPYKLTFPITDRCNSRCLMCGIWKRKAKNELSLDEITKFFSRSNRFSWIDLTGGEVFMREDFFEIVEVILRECRNLFLLHFPTNGLLTERIVANVERIQKLKACKTIITVSMDGDREMNDRIRGIPGGWERQMETFSRLRKIPDLHVVLGMTLSPYNYNGMQRAFEAARTICPNLEYNDFHVNIAHVSSHYYNNQYMAEMYYPTEEILREVTQYMKKRGRPLSPVRYLEWEYLRRVERFMLNGKTPMRCHALRSSCFLDPQGNVYPCGMYDAKVGNLRDCGYSMAEIWRSERCKKIQAEIWRFNCPQCWTPCEAYQSILGNVFGQRNARLNLRRV